MDEDKIIVEMGKEDAFHSLLGSDGDEKVKEKLINAPNSSVLDLGCGLGLSLFFMRHDFSFEKLVGVDIDSEEEILKMASKKHNSDFGNSLYDFYCAEFEIPEGVGIKKITNQAEFYKRFTFVFETNIEEYLKLCQDQFDLIICSNILHFIRHKSEFEFIISTLNNILKKDGLIYIRIKEKPGGLPQRNFGFETYSEIIDKLMPERGLGFCHFTPDYTKVDEGKVLCVSNLIA